MRSVLTLVLIFIFFVYALRSSYAAMLMYWWFGIFRPQDWMYWDVSDLRLALIVAVIFYIRNLLTEGIPRLTGGLTWLLIFWLFVAVIGDIANGCHHIFGSTVTRFALLILSTLLTAQLLTSKKRIYFFVFVVTCSLALQASNLGIQSLLSGGSSSYGITIGAGSFTGSNAFSMGVAMIFLFIFFLYSNSEILKANLPSGLAKSSLVLKSIPVFYILISIGSIYAIISLFSRGSALALALGIGTFVLLQKRRIKWITISLILGVVFVAVAPLPSGYVERIESAFKDEEELDDSAKSRPHFWNTAKLMAEDNPLGVGIGCYPSYYDAYDITEGRFGHYRSVHSSHYQMIAETGYLGFSIWVLFHVVALLKLLSIRRKCLSDKYKESIDRGFYLPLSISLFCSLQIFLVGGSFYEFSHNEISWAVFAIIIALDRKFSALKKNSKT